MGLNRRSVHPRVGAMNDEHSPLRALKQKWEEEEAARDTQEEHAQQLFLEAEASLTFAPIEDFLTRLGKVLSAAGASVEIDTAWDHVSDRRLRRAARIMSSNPPGRLSLDFVIQGMSIFYRVIRNIGLLAGSGSSYRLSPPTLSSSLRRTEIS
jgi:hypothetical protein